MLQALQIALLTTTSIPLAMIAGKPLAAHQNRQNAYGCMFCITTALLAKGARVLACLALVRCEAILTCGRAADYTVRLGIKCIFIQELAQLIS